MKLYGLVAEGASVNGWAFTMRSKRLFRTPEKALAHKPEFVKKCCDPKYFEYAVESSLQITVVGYELV